MCLLVVICNIQTIKLSEIFGLTISLGNISYGALFLTTDIISEKYGRSSATEATNLSFVFMILFTILMYLFLQYTPCNSDFSQNAFKVTRKGGNQTILYYPNEVKYALEEWLTIRETLPIDKEEKALFLSLQNRRICTRAVENIVKKFASESTPLKKITPHKLRSTFGTNLYRETNDIYIVADVLGHKDVNTTKKHYAAISDDLRRNVAKKVKIGYEE